MNRDKIFISLILLSFLIFGFIVGRYVGLAESNNFYQEEETIEILCSNPEEQQELGNGLDYTLSLNFT